MSDRRLEWASPHHYRGGVVVLARNGCDTFVGRRRRGRKADDGRWGNPFKITKNRSRAAAVMAYERHLLVQLGKKQISATQLADLYGDRLGCYCVPELCHGHVILLYVRMAHYCMVEKRADQWSAFLTKRMNYLNAQPQESDYERSIRRQVDNHSGDWELC